MYCVSLFYKSSVFKKTALIRCLLCFCDLEQHLIYDLSTHHPSEFSVPVHSLCFPSISFEASFFFFFRKESILAISLTIYHNPYETHAHTILFFASIVSFILVPLYSPILVYTRDSQYNLL